LLTRAEAPLAVGEWSWDRSAGRVAVAAARTRGPDAVAAVEAGNAGQVDGAVRMALPEAGSASAEAVCRFMAQWWAPWRRQQAGRRASRLASSVAANGPSEKNASRKMDTRRRMLGLMLHERGV